MISIYKTIEDDMVVLDKIEEGCWISAIHPNEEELTFLDRVGRWIQYDFGGHSFA